MKVNYIGSPLTDAQRMEYRSEIAPALFDGGWRPEDRNAMMKEYDLCDEAADIIIDEMIAIMKSNNETA